MENEIVKILYEVGTKKIFKKYTSKEIVISSQLIFDDKQINQLNEKIKEKMREVLIEFEVMARKNAFGLPEKSYLDNDLKDNVAGMVDNFLKEREG